MMLRVISGDCQDSQLLKHEVDSLGSYCIYFNNIYKLIKVADILKSQLGDL